MLYCAKIIEETDLKRRRMKSEDRKMKEIEMTKMVEEMDPVSYTHLTLPTN